MAAILLLLLASIAFLNASKLNYIQGNAYFTYSNAEKEGFVVVFQPEETYLSSTEFYLNLAPPPYYYTPDMCDETTLSLLTLTSRDKMTWDSRGRYYYVQLYSKTLKNDHCYGYKVEICNTTGCYYNHKTSAYFVDEPKYCALDSQLDDYSYKCSEAVKNDGQDTSFYTYSDSSYPYSDSYYSSGGSGSSGSSSGTVKKDGQDTSFYPYSDSSYPYSDSHYSSGGSGSSGSSSGSWVPYSSGFGILFSVVIFTCLCAKRRANAQRRIVRRQPGVTPPRVQPARGTLPNIEVVRRSNPLYVPSPPSYAQTMQGTSIHPSSSAAENCPANAIGRESNKQTGGNANVTDKPLDGDCPPPYTDPESGPLPHPEIQSENATESQEEDSVTITMSDNTLGITNPLYDQASPQSTGDESNSLTSPEVEA